MSENGFKVYRLYCSLKAHFKTDNYDVFRFRGRITASEETYLKRNDFKMFERLSIKESGYCLEFMLASFIDSPNTWIGDFLTEEAEEIYLKWKGRISRIYSNFEEDLDGICYFLQKEKLTFNDILKVNNGQLPIIIKMCQQKIINIETVVMINCITGYIDVTNIKLKGDYVFEEIGRKIKKYEPFLKIDKEKTKQIIKNKIIG